MEPSALMQENISQAWERVKARLRATYGDATYKNWLSAMNLEGCAGSQVTITVPTRFMREWIQSHYIADLLRFWKLEDPSLLAVDVRVRTAGTNASASAAPRSIQVHTQQSHEPASFAAQPLAHGYESGIGCTLDPR